jgi:hypothetical protein
LRAASNAIARVEVVPWSMAISAVGKRSPGALRVERR